MVAAHSGSSDDIDFLINQWSSLSPNSSEADLNARLTNSIWHFLGLNYNVTPTIEGGIRPDYLVYDYSGNPSLLVEIKKRVSALANCSDNNFVTVCQNHTCYKDAVFGNQNSKGIQQYLSVDSCPAKYGLVFNGDFFQLFRRVDGLVTPLTSIQRVTAETLPHLVKQLQHYLKNPNSAFVVSMWNRKGGVAKTTNIINIAAVLSEMGKRVLVVDFDPQVDLTTSLGLKSENYKAKILACFDKIQTGEGLSARELLINLIQTKEFVNSATNQCHVISILPGHKQTLENFGEHDGDDEGGYSMKGKETALKRLLSLVKSQYDYILIDTSPKADILTVCSLFSADGVIIPSDCDPETLRHTKLISKDYIPNKICPVRQKMQSKKLPLDDIGPQILGVVLSNWPKLGVTMENKVEQYLTNLEVKIYQTKLRKGDSVPIAKFAHSPVVFRFPNSPISKLYRELTKEIFIKPNFIH